MKLDKDDMLVGRGNEVGQVIGAYYFDSETGKPDPSLIVVGSYVYEREDVPSEGGGSDTSEK